MSLHQQCSNSCIRIIKKASLAFFLWTLSLSAAYKKFLFLLSAFYVNSKYCCGWIPGNHRSLKYSNQSNINNHATVTIPFLPIQSDGNINWNPWPICAMFHALCFCQMISSLDTCMMLWPHMCNVFSLYFLSFFVPPPIYI